jgi:hypothetical protein
MGMVKVGLLLGQTVMKPLALASERYLQVQEGASEASGSSKGKGEPVVGVEDGFKVRRVGGGVHQDAQELEVQSFAQTPKVLKHVGLSVGGLAPLRVFIHATDDV